MQLAPWQTPFLNRIMELDDFDNDLDYNIVLIYTQEKPIPRLIIAVIKP